MPEDRSQKTEDRGQKPDQEPETSDWKRMWFRKNKVWLAVDPEGAPITRDGKVLIKYQREQDYEYWVHLKNLQPIESQPRPPADLTKRRAPKTAHSDDKTVAKMTAGKLGENGDSIRIFTDGASSGNPGPAGIGVFLQYGKHEKEISRFIGTATNNVAELKAIEAGLLALKQTDVPVRLFTDSNYAYGVLALNWKPRKNQQFVESIKKMMARFEDLKIVKVKGHAGHPGNERADFLATSAIKAATR